MKNIIFSLNWFPAQLAGAIEYTGCISAEGYNPTNECPRYDIKLSDGEAL